MKRYLVFFLLPFSLLAQKAEPLGTAVNSEYNELHPLISADGKTLFLSGQGILLIPKGKNIRTIFGIQKKVKMESG